MEPKLGSQEEEKVHVDTYCIFFDLWDKEKDIFLADFYNKYPVGLLPGVFTVLVRSFFLNNVPLPISSPIMSN